MASEHTSDEVLISWLVAGGRFRDRAVALLIQRYRPKLTLFVVRAAPLALREDVPDIVQETLLSVFGVGSSIDWHEVYDVGGLLVNTARWRLERAKRTRRRRPLILLAEPADCWARSRQVSARLLLERRDLLERLIERLPSERQRTVVRMHVVLQMELQEVAGVLGISPAGARMAFKRAVDWLKGSSEAQSLLEWNTDDPH